MLLCRVPKRGQCIEYISCTRSILPLRSSWRSEAHGDVDAADHQDSFLGFHLSGYLGRQAPVAGVNLARFQRASKRAHHSTGGCGDNVIESRGVRFLERPRINLVMLGDGSVNAKSHRL